MVLAAFALIVMLAFAAFAIDTGLIALHKTKMQNAVDAAALGAAMEITHAIENAPPGEVDPSAYARQQARQVAADIAAANGVYLDPGADVEFGLRRYNPDASRFEVQWGEEPANVVRVSARRDNDVPDAPDAKLPMMFARVLGEASVTLGATAVAYIESRDISVVLDFSGSMAYDSLFREDSLQKLGDDAIRDNLRQMFWELETADGLLGTLDHSDPDDSASPRDAEPKWLVVHSPDSGDPGEPDVDVTFMYGRIHVDSDTTYQSIKLEFDNGKTQTIDQSATSGTYAGSGQRAGDEIETVWVIFPGGDDVTIGGQSGQGCRPHVDVTFHGNGTSVVIESTKDLSNVVLEFDDGSQHKFDGLNQGRTGTFAGVGQHAGKVIAGVWVKSGCNQSGDGPGYGERFDAPDTGQSSVAIRFDDTNANVKAYFQLSGTNYPFDSGDWDDYIDYVRSSASIHRGTHREMYGGVTFIHYLLEQQPGHHQTPALAKTSHYPFHAVRKGNELFVDFLDTLGFSDHVGLVSYDQERRMERYLFDGEGGAAVNISADPLGSHRDALRRIMQHKQASHYAPFTNIGGGIREARNMLADHGRPGARPTILLMTDGNANTYDNQAGENSREWGFSDDGFWDVPGEFEWSKFDNLETSQPFYVPTNGAENKARRYALSQAFQAVQDGYTVHTLAVGAGADRDLMKAIAHLGGGAYIEVSGDLSVERLLQQVETGFFRIASLLPPPRLAHPDDLVDE
jgi:hypothetical protein